MSGRKLTRLSNGGGDGGSGGGGLSTSTGTRATFFFLFSDLLLNHLYIRINAYTNTTCAYTNTNKKEK